MATRVLGADAAGRFGWVAIVVEDGDFASASIGADLAALIAAAEPLAAVGVDIPIGQVASGIRACDRLARQLLGRRSSSVFAAPPADVLHAVSQAEANARLRARGAPALSAQAWALVPKIIEASTLAAGDDRLHEVHPEVSFAALEGDPLAWSKRTWAGETHRRRLLAAAGLAIPADLGPAGIAAAHDVLDAAVVAWSAVRIAAGVADSAPDPPEVGIDGRPVAIWF